MARHCIDLILHFSSRLHGFLMTNFAVVLILLAAPALSHCCFTRRGVMDVHVESNFFETLSIVFIRRRLGAALRNASKFNTLTAFAFPPLLARLSREHLQPVASSYVVSSFWCPSTIKVCCTNPLSSLFTQRSC